MAEGIGLTSSAIGGTITFAVGGIAPLRHIRKPPLLPQEANHCPTKGGPNYLTRF